VLNDKNYSFWLIAYDLSKTEDDESVLAKINDLYTLATGEKSIFIAMTASGPAEVEAFKKKHNVQYTFVSVDATVLKTMIRSNPGLMLIKDGAVIANWHYNNLPTFSEVKQKFMK
jgi:hypothetical protein